MAPSIIFSLLIFTLFSSFAFSLEIIEHNQIITKNHIKSLKFTLYLHETFNKTGFFVVKGVAGPTAITKTSNPFGSLYACNEPLTETLDPSSKVIGYVEGMAVTTSFKGDRTTSLSRVTLDLEGYKGDLLNVGTSYYDRVSELPFVGGTGDFRFAQGYLISSPVDLSGPTTRYKLDFTVYWPPYANLGAFAE